MAGKLQMMTLGLSVALLAACSSDDSNKNNPPKPSVKWEECAEYKTLECAELKVPMDYSDVAGKQIDIALIRKPASEANTTQSLLFNPGGPGGSGLELLSALDQADLIPDKISSTYNLISFDPRGVGESTPVDCTGFGANDISVYPLDAAAVTLLHEQRTNYSKACSDKHGDYLTQLGSLNVVRDMDEIRKSIAEEKLNFIGYSYGTRLAALYLQEFPGTSGRIILDASVHPDSSVKRLFSESQIAQQANLRLLLSQCTGIDPDCDVDVQLEKFNARVRTLSSDFSAASQEEFEILGDLILSAVTMPEFGQLFADTAYNYLLEPDISVLQNFINQLPSELLAQPNINTTAQVAVICADDAARPTPEDLQMLLTELNLTSDAFAEFNVAQIASCAGWPEAPEPLPVIATGAAPLSLVIGGTTDAQTPLTWSESMSQAIGGVFIRSEHSGHVSVFVGKSECANEIAINFLSDGLAPTVTECPAQ